MVGCHHWLDGHECEQPLGAGDGQGGLVCYSPWGHRVGHDWATELKSRKRVVVLSIKHLPCSFKLPPHPLWVVLVPTGPGISALKSARLACSLQDSPVGGARDRRWWEAGRVLLLPVLFRLTSWFWSAHSAAASPCPRKQLKPIFMDFRISLLTSLWAQRNSSSAGWWLL